MKRTTVFLVMVIAATLIPVSAHAGALLDRRADRSVVGKGAWTGTATLSCDRVEQPSEATPPSVDKCTYAADSAPSDEQPEEGCVELANESRVTGCRATLAGATQANAFPLPICLQGGPLRGNLEYPIGGPDGRVTIYSGTLREHITVPVSITVNGSFGRVFGTRHLEAPDMQIVVEGKFLWNTRGEQACPLEGTAETAGGVWQGHYTFIDTTR